MEIQSVKNDTQTISTRNRKNNIGENIPPAKFDIMSLMEFMGKVIDPGKRNRYSEYEKLRDYLQLFKINATYEDLSDKSDKKSKEIGRVIISPIRTTNKPERKLTYEANGIVLDSETWRVVSMPPETFAINPRKSDIIANLGEYDIYKISDGTTITLYNWKDKWCFSTTNGFDTTGYKWVGDITYEEAFNEVVSKYYPEFSLDKLNKGCSYSIGFKSRHFHPFEAEKECAWFIRCYDLSEMKDIIETVDIGIPKQTKISIDSGKSAEVLFKEIEEQNDKALTRYIAESKRFSGKTLDYSAIMGKNPDDHIHYGYILRSINNENIKCRNVCLESELLKEIRRLMYNLPKQNKGKHSYSDISVHPTKIAEYCALRAFLHRSKNFKALFPGLAHIYDDYGKLLDKIVAKIIQCMTNKKYKSEVVGGVYNKYNDRKNKYNSGKTVKEKQENPNKSDKIEDKINKLTSVFVDYVSKNHITATNEDAKSLIKDLIRSPEFIRVYFLIYVE